MGLRMFEFVVELLVKVLLDKVIELLEISSGLSLMMITSGRDHKKDRTNCRRHCRC